MSQSHPNAPHEPAESASKVNEALGAYSDKDWNYSRISLETRPLQSLVGPYALWIEWVDTDTRDGKQELKTLQEEITWGSRHSNELGMAELVSLRINKALCEGGRWPNLRPVVRLVRKELLVQQGIAIAFWYRIEEVGGEDFDSR